MMKAGDKNRWSNLQAPEVMCVRGSRCRPYGVCVVTFLSPLRGLHISHPPTHGLRRGLHSVAASRLKKHRALHVSQQHGAITQNPAGLVGLFHRYSGPSGANECRAFGLQEAFLLQELARYIFDVATLAIDRIV